jgi:hypothetical protein
MPAQRGNEGTLSRLEAKIDTDHNLGLKFCNPTAACSQKRTGMAQNKQCEPCMAHSSEVLLTDKDGSREMPSDAGWQVVLFCHFLFPEHSQNNIFYYEIDSFCH